MNNPDQSMTRLTNRIMGATQSIIETLSYTLEEMQYIAEQNPGREDVKACIDEIKRTLKADEYSHMTVSSKWSEHFDGISLKEDAAAGEPAADAPADKTDAV